jgi:hypothetical protein
VFLGIRTVFCFNMGGGVAVIEGHLPTGWLQAPDQAAGVGTRARAQDL